MRGKYDVNELVGYSRLWKFEGNETFEDAKELLSQAQLDKKPFPLDI